MPESTGWVNRRQRNQTVIQILSCEMSVHGRCFIQGTVAYLGSGRGVKLLSTFTQAQDICINVVCENISFLANFLLLLHYIYLTAVVIDYFSD